MSAVFFTFVILLSLITAVLILGEACSFGVGKLFRPVRYAIKVDRPVSGEPPPDPEHESVMDYANRRVRAEETAFKEGDLVTLSHGVGMGRLMRVVHISGKDTLVCLNCSWELFTNYRIFVTKDLRRQLSSRETAAIIVQAFKEYCEAERGGTENGD